MNNKTPILVGTDTQFGVDVDGLHRKHTQEIPQSFLDDIKDQRNASLDRREGDYMSVAQIPVVIVEKWMREGFDIMTGEHSAADIVKKLKAENLDAFLTTDKRV